MGRFEGKVVIVSGSSTGIGRGRGIALLFGKEGAKLTITGRNPDSLDETRSLLVAAGVKEENIHHTIGDLRDEAVQDNLVQSTVDKFGHIDVLVNNAGGGAPDMAGINGFNDSLDNYDYVMQLNTRSVLRVSMIALPHLEKTKGEVIMISSIAALPIAMEYMPFYAASKAALDQLMRGFSMHAIKKGVRVNGINPGAVESDIMLKQGVSKELGAKMQALNEADPMALPVGRYGTPEDIANLVAFLADRKLSGFIVGQSIVIDGGTSILNPMLSSDPAGKWK